MLGGWRLDVVDTSRMRARDRLDEKRRAKAARRARSAAKHGGTGLHHAQKHHESQTQLNVQEAFMKACGFTRLEAQAAQQYMDRYAHKLGKNDVPGMMKLFEEAREFVKPRPPDPEHVLEAMGIDGPPVRKSDAAEAMLAAAFKTVSELYPEELEASLKLIAGGDANTTPVSAPGPLRGAVLDGFPIDEASFVEGLGVYELPPELIPKHTVPLEDLPPAVQRGLLTGDFSVFEKPLVSVISAIDKLALQDEDDGCECEDCKPPEELP